MAVGDSYKEEFTPEELAALGREPEGGAETETTEETAGPGETQETTEQTQETNPEQEAASTTETTETKTEQTTTESPKSEEAQAAEAMGFRLETDDKGKTYVVDEDGTRIPATRWKNLYGDYKNAQREAASTKEKFDLFKQLGADEYYRIYPAEAPQGWKPKGAEAAPANAEVDPMKLVFTAKDPNHPYHGMTLGEIKEQDPFFATVLYNDWRDQQREQVIMSRQANERTRQQEEAQANAFGLARAKELFGTDDPGKITPEQSKAILSIAQQVIKWQTENNCLHYSWEHAYKLMRHDELIAKAREEGAKGTIKNLAERKSPASINTAGGSPPKDNSYAAMEKWSDDQLAKHIDGLSDAEYVKFKKEAPAQILERIGL